MLPACAVPRGIARPRSEAASAVYHCLPSSHFVLCVSASDHHPIQLRSSRAASRSGALLLHVSLRVFEARSAAGQHQHQRVHSRLPDLRTARRLPGR